MRISIYSNSDNTGTIGQYINEYFLAANFPYPAIDSFDDESSLLDAISQSDILFIDISIFGTDYLNLVEAVKRLNMNVIVFVLSPSYDCLKDKISMYVFRYMSFPLDRLVFFTNLRQALNLYSRKPSTVAIESRRTVHVLPTDDITYIEKSLNSSLVHTLHGLYKSNRNMQYWEELLCNTYFVKINSKSFINVHYVQEFKQHELSLKDADKSTLPVSSKYVSRIKNCLSHMPA